ncbi:MAG TPA: beta-galactosidase [Bacteroidota bacterium]|jgi:beta-galactosidase|nr:beta-galactosidase [Bacteroidota bacterium]
MTLRKIFVVSRSIVASLLFCATLGLSQRHTFSLGDKDFLLDGKPFQIISGEMHFARIPKEYWRQRLKMARAMGLNTIATYVFWNYHEPEKGKFDFRTESRDIAEFVRIAQEESLWVIIRPGPYACAEWEFGGYPSWLLKEKDLVVRGNDARFLDAAGAYLRELGKELVPLQVTHGGPIILVQVENEYGSFGNDKEFVGHTRDQIRSAGFDVPLFSADGPTQCRNAFLPDVLPAINGEENPRALRDTVDTFHNGKGPYFSPEFYPGWLDHWGEDHADVPAKNFIAKYDTLLMNGISVSLYMFHGGTNFGFMNGANYGGKFQPQPTSYDYDAPLDEAGRPTPKYFAFRDVISKYLPAGTRLPEVPASNPVIEIPPFELKQTASVFDALPKAVTAWQIPSMEDLSQAYGYILYRTNINHPGKIDIKGLRDYALVFVDHQNVATLDRRNKQHTVNAAFDGKSAVLEILVENGGRINYGRQMHNNRKGITESVTLDGKELSGWEVFPLPMTDVPKINFAISPGTNTASFHRGTFNLTTTGDAFLDMRGWGKGAVWVNGHNLGRFWYIGPQQTLYLPGVWLKKGENEIIAFDLERHDHHTIQGLKEPILNSLVADKLAPPLPVRIPGTLRLRGEDLFSSGEFMPGDSAQTRTFASRRARYVCLQSLSSLRNDPFASMGEFYVLDEQGKRLPRDNWKVYTVESEELKSEDGRAENAFDDDPESIWHTQWGDAQPPHPHYIAIDLGKEETVSGFQYQSRIGNAPGKIKEYRFYVRKEPFERIN